MKTNKTKSELELTISIPLKEGNKPAVRNYKAYAMDVIGSFSLLLASALKHRMEACQNKLLTHINSIFFNDGCQVMWYNDKQEVDYFNVPSYEEMKKCYTALKVGRYVEVVDSPVWIDQLLKALLNDEIPMKHDNTNRKFKYSELVSVLCQLHTMPIHFKEDEQF